MTAAVAGAMAIFGAPPGGAAAPDTPGAARAEARQAKAGAAGLRTVTLITGDRVRVAADGHIAQVEPGPGREGQVFTRFSDRGRWYVVPQDAKALIGAGKVDRRLFDVTGLIAGGFDDRRADVPLLVTGASGVRAKAARAPAAPAGTKVTRSLPGLGLTAVSEPKKDATRIWAQLRSSLSRRAVAPGATARVWLNGRAQITLDTSVPQIGAPTAWQSGYTGKSVKVAVLDTGYDQAHPDLAGVVSEARDFSASPEGVQDTVGHGTHVASTVAGRGTASGGKYVGVAKEAELLIGRVCGSRFCEDAAILAGMEWAARSGAKVVNMSLGTGPTDGTDPMSQSVNALSSQYGTLFVVAAGNSGDEEPVSAPAVAESALAVASVTKRDVLSDFSSRGPRLGGYAVKPDLAAPGQDIVAARAADTGEPAENDRYTSYSGTSMAAPHVSGAAAIVRQQHPDWGPERVKATLMATSRPVDGASPFNAGAGRTDLARATTQQVTADVGSVSMGLLTWPHTPAQRRTKPVTYRNDGGSPVTLKLATAVTDADDRPAPDGAWSLSASELTVPAGGTASVAVTLDPTRGVGLFGGWLTATSTDGATVVRTALGGYSEEEKHELTVRVTNRDGSPGAGEYVRATPLTGNQPAEAVHTDTDGTARIRLPKGEYALLASPAAYPPGGSVWDAPVSVTDMVVPRLVLDADTSAALDARKAKPVTIEAEGDRKTGLSGHESWIDVRPDRRGGMGSYGTGTTAWYSWSGEGTNPALRYLVSSVLLQPLLQLEVRSPERFAVRVSYASSTGGLLLGDRSFPLVDGGQGRPEDLTGKELKGALVLLRAIGDRTMPDISRRLAAAGAAAALLVGGGPLDPERYALPVTSATTADATRLVALVDAGQVTVATHGIASSPVAYNLVMAERGTMPTGKRYVARRAELAELRVQYRSLGVDGASARVDNFPLIDGQYVLTAIPQRVTAPAKRVEYYTAAPVTWSRRHMLGQFFGGGDTDPYAGEWAEATPVALAAGSNGNRVWGNTPLGPALPGEVLGYGVPEGIVERTGNQIEANIPVYSAAAQAGTTVVGSVMTAPGSSLTLRRDGQVVGISEGPAYGSWNVPSGPAEYQLELVAKTDAPQLKLATAVRTTWSFRSGLPGGADPVNLPLLTVACQLPRTDLRNTVPATASTPLEIAVKRQPGSGNADVVTVRAWVSDDDGAHWRAVGVARLHGRWVAQLPGGATGQYVSLRVSATDSTGSTVDQTMVRAYQRR